MSLPPGTGPRLRQVLLAPGLSLEPLGPAHADALWPLLREPALYRYLDHGPPASPDTLRALYGRFEPGTSPDGQEGWGNWALRRPSGEYLGVAQATVNPDGSAWLAYVLGLDHQGQGHARAATAAVMQHLHDHLGCQRFLASVEQAHQRSARLLQALGFRQDDGPARQQHGLGPSERLWVRDGAPAVSPPAASAN